MRIRIDAAAFHAQRQRYALRFCCEECAYFVAEHCAHFWPTEDHRRARYDQTTSAQGELDVVFCKEFELR